MPSIPCSLPYTEGDTMLLLPFTEKRGYCGENDG